VLHRVVPIPGLVPKLINRILEHAGTQIKSSSPGTNSRLAYLKALQQLEIDYVEQITKMGVLPKNVTSQTQTQYIFKAHVGKGGSVQTTPVNTKQLQEIERAEARGMREGHGRLTGG
jgi:hypothetical protein